MRYQIWNEMDDIYTLTGECFTADEWKKRHSWINIPGTKMIIGAGAINGIVAQEFEATKADYLRRGAAIAEEMTDNEVLAAIEAFENDPPDAHEPSNEERIAAALEAQVMLAEADIVPQESSAAPVAALMTAHRARAATQSPALARIRRNVERGLWDPAIVRLAVRKGHITASEGQSITGEIYGE